MKASRGVAKPGPEPVQDLQWAGIGLSAIWAALEIEKERRQEPPPGKQVLAQRQHSAAPAEGEQGRPRGRCRFMAAAPRRRGAPGKPGGIQWATFHLCTGPHARHGKVVATGHETARAVTVTVQRRRAATSPCMWQARPGLLCVLHLKSRQKGRRMGPHADRWPERRFQAAAKPPCTLLRSSALLYVSWPPALIHIASSAHSCNGRPLGGGAPPSRRL